MHLKSLVLKGFKSFADRAELAFEPGIVAVVGPNGSGKSNISDAVLWVLGERNAKNLRGQVMEDVIFAGSSARKSVRVAEVELVLDNSDGTLPVDYTEISIARRMYRSGESEYLINGSVARRLDALDILHDLGLGAGTNSIISQGHLDALLQSKPENRRELIEEVAGVLKHKQRKAKGARKLEQMEQHLARVRDVANEVARQLGPLKRRANRAIAYQEATKKLSELTLQLAVDDLRNLQCRWNELEQNEAALVAEVEKRHSDLEIAETEAERIQETIRHFGTDSEVLLRSRQRASVAVGSLDTTVQLISETLRASQRRCEELRKRLAADAERIHTARIAQTEAEAHCVQADDAYCAAKLEMEQARAAYDAATQQRTALEREVSTHQQEARKADAALERAYTSLRSLKEKHAADKEKLQLFTEQLTEANKALAYACEACEMADSEHTELEARLVSLQAQEEVTRQAYKKASAASAEAEAKRLAAADAQRAAEADIAAIETIERSAATALGEARTWLVSHSDDAGVPTTVPIADLATIDEGYESLVEAILGFEAAALVVTNEVALVHAVEAVRIQDKEGEIALVARSGCGHASLANAARTAAARCGGLALIDVIHPLPGAEAVIEALVGDVVVCDNEQTALAAHRENKEYLRFATKTGCVIWPSGKTIAGVRVAPEGQGAFARARQRSAARKTLEAMRAAHQDAEVQLATLQAHVQSAHEAYLSAQRELSHIEGSLAASTATVRDVQATLKRRELDVAQATERLDKVRQACNEVAPRLVHCEEEVVTYEATATAAAEALAKAEQAVIPARSTEAHASQALSEARLAQATLTEQLEFAKRTCAATQRELNLVCEDQKRSQRTLENQTHLAKRATELIAILEDLTIAARLCAEGLEQQAADARAAADGVHLQFDEARARVKQAREAFDTAHEQLSAVRVEKGGLSVRVEAGVSAIVAECNTPLEQALELPALEDRASIENEAFHLRRRIAHMGTVNPDAVLEYEQLKNRHDYLAAQLTDLDSARNALKTIDHVIDERMKGDFITTFDQVNKSFQEIFSLLFPGGSAELSLTDPDDPESSGVEVSAQPRGKRIAKMSLMSGGEKSLVALALLFAAYRIRSAPFYILDEVEAALDDTNLRRLTSYLNSLRETTQLILITHQRRTMEIADVLFGVSMQADGVTKVISQRLEHALRYAEG